jgi:hypothetical protein
LFDGFEEGDEKFAGLHFPVGDEGALHLVDGDFFGKLDVGLFRGALGDFEIYVGGEGGGVFAEADELGERAAHAQGKRGVVVFGLAAPGEGHGLGAFAVGGPLVAAVGEIGSVGEEAAVEREVDTGAGNFESDFGDAGEGGRNGEALFTGGRRNGQGDFERDYRAAGMGEKRGELRGIFSGGRRREREGFAVELGFADEKAAGNGDADPAVFEDVDGEGGAAGGEIGVDAEVVIDAGEGGVDGRRFGLAFGGIGFHAEGAVFGDGDDYPARGMVCILRSQRLGWTESEQAQGCE